MINCVYNVISTFRGVCNDDGLWKGGVEDPLQGLVRPGGHVLSRYIAEVRKEEGSVSKRMVAFGERKERVFKKGLFWKRKEG